MTVYEFLKKDNTIEKLFNSGVITFDKKCHFIYVDNVYEMMKKGIAKTEAVRETSIKCQKQRDVLI